MRGWRRICRAGLPRRLARSRVTPKRTWNVHMKYLAVSAVLSGCLICVSMYGQPTPAPVNRTTVCEIVRHPEQFEGKLVQVRAQIWSYEKNYWLNESLVDSLQIGQSCGWLLARFTSPTNPVGNIAFGTFTGTVVGEHGSLGEKEPVRFVIERQEDICSREVQIHNGPIRSWRPVLYDQPSGTLFLIPK